jgi:ATP-dependent Lon protease
MASEDYDDPDYSPDEDDSTEEEWNDDDSSGLIQLVFTGAPTVVINAGGGNGYYNEEETPSIMSQCPRSKRHREEEEDEIMYTRDELTYYDTLSERERARIHIREKRIKEARQHTAVPLRFKILDSDMDARTQSLVLAKLEQFQRMHEGSGEYFKLRNWLDSVCRLPLGRYHTLPVVPTDPLQDIAAYLQGVRGSLDKTVFGHGEAKDQIMRILAQWIANPRANGHCIGIHGPMGAGKTSLLKNGLCKALNMPFGFIALGGAADGSFLEGHGFTYEGSTYGKIAEVLMKTQVMNPILYFDELDKVSQTRRGEEIIGILTHLTDSSQNERYNDRYFGEIDINLSKALIVFSYNDESLINPILKDRMVTIRVKGYNTKEKIVIARDYLIPEIMRQYSLTATDITFTDDIIERIISRVPAEEGVRNLKRGIECIVGWMNMQRFVPAAAGESLLTFPTAVTDAYIDKFVKRSNAESTDILHTMYM